MLPKSSHAVKRSMRVTPVAGSISTSQMYVPDGYVKLVGS